MRSGHAFLSFGETSHFGSFRNPASYFGSFRNPVHRGEEVLPYARAVKAAMREYRLDDSRLGADEDSTPDASTGGGGARSHGCGDADCAVLCKKDLATR